MMVLVIAICILTPGRKHFLGTFPARAADNSILERRVKQICATIVITDNAEQFTVLPNKRGFSFNQKAWKTLRCVKRPRPKPYYTVIHIKDFHVS